MDKFRVLKPETIKALIDVVRNYPEIYAVGHSDYKNAYKKEMAWKKIKVKMGMDVRTLKIKWKNLRDTYRKHKLCRRTGNKGTGNLSNWVWANEMSFIDPYIKLRPIDISLDSTDSEVNDNTDDENEQNETQKVQSPEPETATVKRSQIKRRRHESDGDTSDNIITNINTEKNTERNTEKNTERNTQETVVNVPCDRTDMEFLGYANTVKRLSVRSQALIKLQITKILTRYQLEELCNDRKSSTLSNDLCNEDGSNITTVQLTDLQPYFVDVEKKHTPDTQSSSST